MMSKKSLWTKLYNAFLDKEFVFAFGFLSGYIFPQCITKSQTHKKLTAKLFYIFSFNPKINELEFLLKLDIYATKGYIIPYLNIKLPVDEYESAHVYINTKKMFLHLANKKIFSPSSIIQKFIKEYNGIRTCSNLKSYEYTKNKLYDMFQKFNDKQYMGNELEIINLKY